MINLGSGKVKDLRLGSSKIKKAFLGTALVWERVVIIVSKSTKYKNDIDNYILFDWENIDSSFWNMQERMKYVIIDNKYKINKNDFYIASGAITIKNNVEPSNRIIENGVRIEFVFEA